MNANEKQTHIAGTARRFVESTNPRSSVRAWEISPCLEFPDHEGGGYTEAFETVAEADEQADEAGGPLFWGVYAILSEEAVAAGGDPAIHLKDFGDYAAAVAFVNLLNGIAG